MRSHLVLARLALVVSLLLIAAPLVHERGPAVAVPVTPLESGSVSNLDSIAVTSLESSASRILLPHGTTQASQGPLVANYGRLPLSFEVNEGQAGGNVKFFARGSGYGLYLTSKDAVIALKKPAPSGDRVKGLVAELPGKPNAEQPTESVVVRMELAGGNTHPRIVGTDELPGKVNYFIGNDPKKWRTNVPTYAKVKYEGVYPGVDLIYYGNQGQLEYDFVVAAGANPSAIQLKFATGRKLHIDNEGGLVLGGDGSEVRFEKPVVYQEHGAGKIPVEGSYVVAADNRIRFRLGDYDHSLPLVVDPVLSYSTYLGGSAADSGAGIAVDASGNAYVTGTTSSLIFPTANPLQATYGGGHEDAFVAKLNSTGTALVYSTYLGGSGGDFANAIAVDTAGNAYVTGSTYSTNFPTVNPIQTTLHSSTGINAFVSKLNSSGSALVYSTYLGGSGSDSGAAIAVDAPGNAYVAGGTTSTNFPTVTPIQATNLGTQNAFITKLNASGSALVYSTYLGGSVGDFAAGIAVDTTGDAYVTGVSTSTNFPTVNPFQATFRANSNAFVSKLNSSGSALIYSTYLGGGITDSGAAIAVDGSGNAYVTGSTQSTDFPTTANALQRAFGGEGDAFVTKLNPSGSAVVYSTYLGGFFKDAGAAIAVDGSGNAYVTGVTFSSGFVPVFPTVAPLQTYGGAGDAFVSIINPSGSALVFSTFLGGSSSDTGAAIALDGSHNVYVTGSTQSIDFPTVNPLQPTPAGPQSIFVAKISTNTPFTALASSLNPSYFGQSVTFTATVTGSLVIPTGTVNFLDGATSLGSSPINGSGVATLSTSILAVGSHTITATYSGDSNLAPSTSAPLAQLVNLATLKSITVSPNPATVAVGHTLQFTATGNYSGGTTRDLTTSVIWSSLHKTATISNAAGSQGLATGVEVEKGDTITASQGTISGTAKLTITQH